MSPYSVRMRENTDQNNSEYGYFSRSEYYVYKFDSVASCYLQILIGE